jgi:glycosyltransferase involved in cell wall biosynthesis
LVVDWWEVWTPAYWRAYLGRFGGAIGWLIQRACARVEQRAFCFSQLQARRLRQAGFPGEATVLGGVAPDLPAPAPPVPPAPLVVFVGRHIPEKRVTALIPALVEARRTLPALRATIVGNGPERPALARLIAAHGLDKAIDLPGFVDEATLDGTLRRALCLVLPSRREGYGLVVVEAAARGVPSVVVRAPDNAATELIEEGVNGFVAPSAAAADLAAAILRAHVAGMAMRQSTAEWFAANAERLSLSGSLPAILAAYASE